jgi:hypothetical protein
MARANRHHLAGYVWHITHRCHKREFLLKFDKDKKEFVMETKAKLGAKTKGRRGLESNEGYELKEPQSPYHCVFDPEKCSLRLKNDHIWEVS